MNFKVMFAYNNYKKKRGKEKRFRKFDLCGYGSLWT